jgi:hypothetical protein
LKKKKKNSKEAKNAHKRGQRCPQKKKKKKKKAQVAYQKKKKKAQDATYSLPLAQSWLALSFSAHSWLFSKRCHSCPFSFSLSPQLALSSLKEAIVAHFLSLFAHNWLFLL